MKKYFNISILCIFILCSIGCSKEAMVNAGKLTNNQVQARLRNFPDLLALNAETEGGFQVTSMRTALGFSLNQPSKDDIMGVVYNTIGGKQGVDAGTLSVGEASSKLIKHEDPSCGVYYGYNNMNSDNIFGKTVPYKLQKNSEAAIFDGSLYVPEKIGFKLSQPGQVSYLNKSNGVITWTSDPNNDIGVGVQILLSDAKTRKTRSDIFLIDDDGSLEVKDFLKEGDDVYTEVWLRLYRGNGTVKTGNDGKKYKLVIYSTCDNTFSFE